MVLGLRMRASASTKGSGTVEMSRSLLHAHYRGRSPNHPFFFHFGSCFPRPESPKAFARDAISIRSFRSCGLVLHLYLNSRSVTRDLVFLEISPSRGLGGDRSFLPGIKTIFGSCQDYWPEIPPLRRHLATRHGGKTTYIVEVTIISSRLTDIIAWETSAPYGPLFRVAVRTVSFQNLYYPNDTSNPPYIMFAHLFDASPEILQNIAFFAILNAPRGPPRDFYNLSLVCRASNRILSIPTAQLYADTFVHNFDPQIPRRRLGRVLFRENAKDELRRRFTTLKVIRRGDLEDPHLTEAFWVAYLMLEDSGASQKNYQQLIGSGLRRFLDDFLRTRLYDGSQDNSGWPLPNERNSLAIALFWLSSSQSSVNIESDAGRVRMMQLLEPFVFAAFRYPIFTTPESCFDPSTFDPRSRGTSIHGPYPPLPLIPREVPYFGSVTYTACVPSAPLFASLSYFVRHERMEPAIPPHLIEAGRQTREEADALGQVGPTIDDMLHFIRHCRTRFAEFPTIDIGIQPPSMTLGQPTPYRMGTLTGRWQGSYIMPFMEAYQQWLEELPAPSEFPATGRFPLYATFQEHFTRDVNSIIPRDSTEQGTLNAWLPSGCNWIKSSNGVEVFDSDGTFRTFYETFEPGESSTKYDDVVDVLITGKTDDRHAAAWGGFHFLGRIRLSDGLMVVSREALGGTGTELVRGYVTSSQNLIGRRKHVSDGTRPAYWESTFSLCRDHIPPVLGPR